MQAQDGAHQDPDDHESGEGREGGADRPDRAHRAAGELVATSGEVRTVFLDELTSAERAALLSWLGFTGTFAAVRAITYSIRSNKGPFRNVSAGSTHLHHYLWGIGMLGVVGAVAVHGSDENRRHPGVALSYGAGLALIVDEFALLLDLRDVYWARQGRVSVDLGIGSTALGATVFAALPLIKRVAQRRSARRPAR